MRDWVQGITTRATTRGGPPTGASLYRGAVVSGTEPWWELLADVLGGRPVVLAVETVGAATPVVRDLERLGAGPVAVVAPAGRGSGAPPDLPSEQVVTGAVHGATPLATSRAVQQVFADPPAEVVALVERIDPRRRGVAVGLGANEVASLAGRPFLSYRRAAWQAYDDKTVVDGLWDRAGVPRAPCETVALEPTALRAAARRLDAGHGTVWAADASAGWHAGAELVRRVTDGAAARAAIDSFGGRSRTVRVMPFLDGIPCSIHGIVFGDRVVALRPLELLVLGGSDGRFVYTGCSSFWDPPADDPRQLTAVAHAVGRRLAVEVGFRGAFTVDGVMTARGFRPTELNPRPGAGLAVLSRRLDLPVGILLDAVVHDPRRDWRPDELAAVWVEHAEQTRSAITVRPGPPGLPEVTGHPVVLDGDQVRPAAVGERADLRYSVGTGPQGSIVRAAVRDDWPRGASVAPLVAAFWAWADRSWGLDLGPLRPAPDLRA